MPTKGRAPSEGAAPNGLTRPRAVALVTVLGRERVVEIQRARILRRWSRCVLSVVRGM